jgi:hypothetical protein
MPKKIHATRIVFDGSMSWWLCSATRRLNAERSRGWARRAR